MKMPKEISIAREAYYKAYDKIQAKVRENKRKYLGTKFEDCPPLIKEQGQFFVKKASLEKTKERLEKKYKKEIPSTWVYWVTWYETNSVQKETVSVDDKAKKRRQDPDS
jgi:hypothetical protein